jgi:hypothetical protein
MVFTLQRYIFREAFKVFVLSAAALALEGGAEADFRDVLVWKRLAKDK